jgi:hypothetical protein
MSRARRVLSGELYTMTDKEAEDLLDLTASELSEELLDELRDRGPGSLSSDASNFHSMRPLLAFYERHGISLRRTCASGATAPPLYGDPHSRN